MNQVAKRLRISGVVQGVGFRAWTASRAEALGLSGWVRNEPDGSVGAVIAGGRAEVARMLKDLWQGPTGASVSEVSSEDCDPPPPGSHFEIRH